MPKINPETDSLEAFQTYLKERDRSPVTIRGYLADLGDFARWFERTNHHPLTPETLTAQDAREYRNWLKDHEKRAPATINRRLHALRAYAGWALSTNRIPSNPLPGHVKLVSAERPKPRWLEKPDQGQLLREADLQVRAANTPVARREAVRNQVILVVMLNTGLRIGELCALETDDYQCEMVKEKGQKKGRKEGTLTVRAGKGMRVRNIPLNADAVQALDSWLELRGTAETNRLFVGRRGDGLRPAGVWKILDRFARRVEVEMTPHRLRHTFAHNLLATGAKITEVADLLGHSSLETTRLYVASGTEDLAAAVKRIGE